MCKIPDLMKKLSTHSRAKVRFFFSGGIEPTDWGKWVISPVEDYLELERYGPFRIKDVERCQIVLTCENDDDVQQLTIAGFCQVGEVYESMQNNVS